MWNSLEDFFFLTKLRFGKKKKKKEKNQLFPRPDLHPEPNATTHGFRHFRGNLAIMLNFEPIFYTYLDIGETKSQEETEVDLEAPKWFLWIFKNNNKKKPKN